MKFKVELEFVVDESLKYNSGLLYNEDGSENPDIIGMARYAMFNLSRFDDLVCKDIGFPGYYTITKIKEKK